MQLANQLNNLSKVLRQCAESSQSLSATVSNMSFNIPTVAANTELSIDTGMNKNPSKKRVRSAPDKDSEPDAKKKQIAMSSGIGSYANTSIAKNHVDFQSPGMTHEVETTGRPVMDASKSTDVEMPENATTQDDTAPLPRLYPIVIPAIETRTRIGPFTCLGNGLINHGIKYEPEMKQSSYIGMPKVWLKAQCAFRGLKQLGSNQVLEDRLRDALALGMVMPDELCELQDTLNREFQVRNAAARDVRWLSLQTEEEKIKEDAYRLLYEKYGVSNPPKEPIVLKTLDDWHHQMYDAVEDLHLEIEDVPSPGDVENAESTTDRWRIIGPDAAEIDIKLLEICKEIKTMDRLHEEPQHVKLIMDQHAKLVRSSRLKDGKRDVAGVWSIDCPGIQQKWGKLQVYGGQYSCGMHIGTRAFKGFKEIKGFQEVWASFNFIKLEGVLRFVATAELMSIDSVAESERPQPTFVFNWRGRDGDDHVYTDGEQCHDCSVTFEGKGGSELYGKIVTSFGSFEFTGRKISRDKVDAESLNEEWEKLKDYRLIPPVPPVNQTRLETKQNTHKITVGQSVQSNDDLYTDDDDDDDDDVATRALNRLEDLNRIFPIEMARPEIAGKRSGSPSYRPKQTARKSTGCRRPQSILEKHATIVKIAQANGGKWNPTGTWAIDCPYIQNDWGDGERYECQMVIAVGPGKNGKMWATFNFIIQEGVFKFAAEGDELEVDECNSSDDETEDDEDEKSELSEDRNRKRRKVYKAPGRKEPEIQRGFSWRGQELDGPISLDFVRQRGIITFHGPGGTELTGRISGLHGTHKFTGLKFSEATEKIDDMRYRWNNLDDEEYERQSKERWGRR